MRKVVESKKEETTELESVLNVAENVLGKDKVVDKEEQSSITFNADIPANVPVSEKLVRVATSNDHTCVIGGKRYSFVKGVCQNVPSNVKDILKRAGLLAPL